MIYSDDPQAVEKLQDKLARLQTQQKRMKALNAAWRKAKKPAPDDVVGWGKIAATLGQDLWQLDRIRVNMARDCLDRAPYTYHISNNNGNMKRIKDRIVKLVREREQGLALGIPAQFVAVVEKEPPYAHQDPGIVREDMAAMTEEEEREAAANEGEWFPPPNANG